MNISDPKSVTVPEIALIAATRGAIGLAPGYCSPESSSEKNERCWAGHFSYQDWRAQFRSLCMCLVRKIQPQNIEKITVGVEAE